MFAHCFGVGYRQIIIFGILLYPGFVNCQGNQGAVNVPSNCSGPLKPAPSNKIHVHLFYDVFTGAYTRIAAVVCLNMPDFGDQMQLDFLPGAGSDDLNGKLDCSLDTCDEAIALQCAKKRVRSYKNYICCRVKGSDNVKCAKDQGVDWDKDIKPCLTTEEPINEIKATVALRKQYNISQTMVPAMTVNGVYDDCTSYALWASFVDTACKLLNPKPAHACGK